MRLLATDNCEAWAKLERTPRAELDRPRCREAWGWGACAEYRKQINFTMTATQSTNYTALVPGFSQSSSTTLEISYLTHKTYFFACFFFFFKAWDWGSLQTFRGIYSYNNTSDPIRTWRRAWCRIIVSVLEALGPDGPELGERAACCCSLCSISWYRNTCTFKNSHGQYIHIHLIHVALKRTETLKTQLGYEWNLTFWQNNTKN